MSASITIQRRLQWMDTDASQVWHHSVIIRWVEEAEAELHRRLGIIDQTFGATPRVRTEFDFGLPVRFDDTVDITLAVEAVGTTSVTYAAEATSAGAMIARGRIVAVLIDVENGGKRPWPDELRAALTG